MRLLKLSEMKRSQLMFIGLFIIGCAIRWGQYTLFESEPRLPMDRAVDQHYGVGYFHQVVSENTMQSPAIMGQELETDYRGGTNADPNLHVLVDPGISSILSVKREERARISDLVDESIVKLREYEATNLEKVSDEEVMGIRRLNFRITPDSKVASEMREKLLGGIRDILGRERAYLYIAEARKALEKELGGYGAIPKNVRVELINGEYYFTESLGDGMELSRRMFRSTVIPDRYQHIFGSDENEDI